MSVIGEEITKVKTEIMEAATLMSPAFACTLVYVNDVAASVEFYARAFGYSVRRLDRNHEWAELETGQATTIAFTPLHQRDTDGLTGTVQVPRMGQERNPVEVCFDYADIDAAYMRAVKNGAMPVSAPEEKAWGQKIGYVRDIDGIVVRMGSYVGFDRDSIAAMDVPY